VATSEHFTSVRAHQVLISACQSQPFGICLDVLKLTEQYCPQDGFRDELDMFYFSFFRPKNLPLLQDLLNLKVNFNRQ